jgi:hypothetical protein
VSSAANGELGRASVGQVKPSEGKMQRGVQENLWPKFIFEGAPLRATSSADNCSIRFANSNRLKMQAPQVVGTG